MINILLKYRFNVDCSASVGLYGGAEGAFGGNGGAAGGGNGAASDENIASISNMLDM